MLLQQEHCKCWRLTANCHQSQHKFYISHLEGKVRLLEGFGIFYDSGSVICEIYVISFEAQCTIIKKWPYESFISSTVVLIFSNSEKISKMWSINNIKHLLILIFILVAFYPRPNSLVKVHMFHPEICSLKHS